MYDTNGPNQDTDKELCIMCGNITDCPKNLPIDKRQNYVEGAGQLCTKCYIQLYGKESKVNKAVT